MEGLYLSQNGKVMRNSIVTIIVFFAFATVSFAQLDGVEGKEKTIKAVEDAIPDSLLYALPEYKSGRITYSSGEFSNGLLNISNIDQSICYKDEKGQILHINNNNDVKYVTIGGKMFFRYAGLYVNVKDVSEDGLANSAQITIFSDAKTGAFGMKSETSSINNYSSFYSNGLAYDLSTSLNFPYKYKKLPFLYHSNKFYPVTKRNLLKFYPAHKEQIEEYVKENRNDFDSYEKISAFFEEVLEK